jgi:F-type H+-transporting ATPase subunit b
MDLLLPDIGLLFWNLLVFLIVFFILKKFAWKPILKSLHERESNIASSLETAERVKAEMAQMKSQAEEEMARAREERAQMVKEARETRDKMIAEAKEQAKAEGARLMAEARQAIEAQKMAAVTDLKNQVGTLVIEVSEKVLRRELADKAGHEAYIKQLTDAVKLN